MVLLSAAWTGTCAWLWVGFSAFVGRIELVGLGDNCEAIGDLLVQRALLELHVFLKRVPWEVGILTLTTLFTIRLGARAISSDG